MSMYKFTNALANETSPYLLQHAHNPVQWYPWSEEALQRARTDDKPILLSIGYSACHWCHVMERESFENEKIAQLMNENFINIKVDREERPDLDVIYMSAVQMLTGSGGWPLTVFLSPDGMPFYGGTYFPPDDRHGMPGFPRVLISISHAYREKRDLIRNDASKIIEEIRKGDSIGLSAGDLNEKILDNAVSKLLSGYDGRHGGFGRAPKFPPSMSLTFLLRSHLRTGNPRLLEVVEHTLQKMACGGFYDQLGGGFHRYSVDSSWLVPHFEKMLYDNALLSRIYLDAWLLTKNGFYRRIAEETLDYVQREMTSPEGGFYSTQDADSEGHEGKFFVWTPGEVKSALGDEEGDLFCRYFDVTPAGNFEGKNILNVPRERTVVAGMSKVPEEEFRRIIEGGRRRLFELREKRAKPARDEKVLAAWNGLMLRSFAEAANALNRPDYGRTAVRNAEFLVSRLEHNGRLRRSWKDGRARFNGYLEDYASLVDGMISVYETTFDLRWIQKAEQFASVLVEDFWDSRGGNFYFTSKDHEELIHRPKDFYDNATPSGNSVAAGALLRLAELTGNGRWADLSRSILSGTADAMANHPYGFGNFLCALDFLLSGPREIAVIGNPEDEQTIVLLREIFERYLPNKVVACGGDNGLWLLNGRQQISGRPTAYVCRNFACNIPATNPEELSRQLK